MKMRAVLFSSLVAGALVALLGCESDSDDPSNADATMSGSGGSNASGGSSSTDADTTTSGSGGTSASGGTSMGGSSATVTSNVGTTGFGGTGGSGGGGGGGGAPDIIGPGGASGCSFQYLGAETHCEGAESRAQDDNHELFAEAQEIEDCAAECAAREDCNAIVDYFGEAPLPRCYLGTTNCDNPVQTGSSEEDAGKIYRKECDGDDCSLEFLGNWLRCAETETFVEHEAAEDLDSCVQACLDDPTCTSVADYFWLDSIRGCYLYTGECDGDSQGPPGDKVRAYRKQCEQ
jgi:hypothetical protein